MKQDIKLFIGDNLVDFSDEISIPFTYQLEDTSNPTAIKNSFTKNITIPSTKNNNKIFGEIYNLDRNLLYDENYILGAYFDPSKRTPFTLYKNSEIVESGYMQLNSISIKNKIINYEITLYGGLGDFFYNLAYTENGDEKTLKDITYGITDDSGNTLPSASEMDFIINKDTINTAWNKLYNTNDDTIFSYINFMPSYNGLSDNFDNDKVLINTNNLQIDLPTTVENNNTTYTTKNGYGLAELQKSFTEWEIRDLRSYMQRPCLKLRKIFEAFFKPENNGGYDVELDPSFFNESNPYWNNTYIALPLLNTLLENLESESEILATANLSNSEVIYIGSDSTTGNTGVQISNDALNLTNISDPSYLSENETIITLNQINVYSSPITISIPFSLIGNLLSTNDGNDEYYLSYNRYGYLGLGAPSIFRSVVVRAELETIDGYVAAYSNEIFNFSNELQPRTGYPTFSNPTYWTNYQAPEAGTMYDVNGTFKKINNNKYVFTAAEGGDNTFALTFSDVYAKSNQFKLKVILSIESQPTTNGQGIKIFVDTNNMPVGGGYPAGWSHFMNSNCGIDIDSSKAYISIYNSTESKMTSGMKVTKDILLSGQKSPLDFLLSYTKLFGLVFQKDIYENKIYIRTKNQYFQNNIIDIDKYIDYSKDISINPIIFEDKFYDMEIEGPETYYYKFYKKNYYNSIYGKKRVNTNYNFNNTINNIFKDNIYENVITIKDKSEYYRIFRNSENIEIPCFSIEEFDWLLFDNNNDSYSQTINNVGFNLNYNEYSIVGGTDILPKICLFDINNKEKKLSDLNYSLVFFNGIKDCKTYNNLPITYNITDDISEMYLFNDDTPCYLYTNSEESTGGAKIAITINTLPQFTKYDINDYGEIKNSLDFGVPKELYNLDGVTYPDNSTLYYKFWEKYISDQLSINTKKITCYVDLNKLGRVNNELLRNFYYFNNSYFIINKIYDYDINSFDTTKVEFILVNDINNYLLSQVQLGNYLIFEDREITVDGNGGELTIPFDASSDWEITYYPTSYINNIAPLSGSGGKNTVTISFNENNKYNDYTFNVSFSLTNNEANYSLAITQLPKPENVVTMSGYIKYNDGTLIPNCHIVASNDNFTNVLYPDESSGFYQIYVAKNQSFNFAIQTSYSTEIYNTNIGASPTNIYRDFTLNKN